MSALGDLAEHVAAEQCFAIEFEAAGVYRYMTQVLEGSRALPGLHLPKFSSRN